VCCRLARLNGIQPELPGTPPPHVQRKFQRMLDCAVDAYGSVPFTELKDALAACGWMFRKGQRKSTCLFVTFSTACTAACTSLIELVCWH
jgi:hypothetical protein